MTEKKKRGRPRTLPIQPEGQRKKTGLQEGDTRATFVVREDLWDEFRQYQNTSVYKSMKDLMQDVITSWLRDHKA